MTDSTAECHKTILFTWPRSASNLLMRILNLREQPSLISTAKKDYYFLSAVAVQWQNDELNYKPLEQWSPGNRRLLREGYQKSFETLEDHVKYAASQSKNVFVKEHAIFILDPLAMRRWEAKVRGENVKTLSTEEAWLVDGSTLGYDTNRTPGNETIFPDEYLESWRPTFLIRHPALLFPSLYRAGVDVRGVTKTAADPKHNTEMTWRWCRTLFDWYRQLYNADPSTAPRTEYGISWPLVLDADDVIDRPDIVKRYCGLVGLDTTKLQFEWEVMSEDVLSKYGKVERRMLSTLAASSGIVKGKTAVDLEIATEAEKWKKEFGEKEGAKLEKWVRNAMPDYEYLRGQRLTA